MGLLFELVFLSCNFAKMISPYQVVVCFLPRHTTGSVECNPRLPIKLLLRVGLMPQGRVQRLCSDQDSWFLQFPSELSCVLKSPCHHLGHLHARRSDSCLSASCSICSSWEKLLVPLPQGFRLHIFPLQASVVKSRGCDAASADPPASRVPKEYE